MEIEGTIILDLGKRTGISKSTGNPWMSQGYVLATNEFHSKKIAFEVTGEDRIRRLNIKVGAYMRVYAEVESREYEGKWYTSVRAWDARAAGTAAVAEQAESEPQPPFPPAPEQTQGAPVAPAPTMPQASSMGPTDTDDAPF